MKNLFTLILISAVFAIFIPCTDADEPTDKKQNDIKLSNKTFSVILPAQAKGIYSAEIKKDRISIYDKDSKKAGFGGFAFGVAIYKNPADHAMLPGGGKIGELTDKKGNLYDVVLK